MCLNLQFQVGTTASCPPKRYTPPELFTYLGLLWLFEAWKQLGSIPRFLEVLDVALLAHCLVRTTLRG